MYERVGAEYRRQGFMPKAMAVAKQVVAICDPHQLGSGSHP